MVDSWKGGSSWLLLVEVHRLNRFVFVIIADSGIVISIVVVASVIGFSAFKARSDDFLTRSQEKLTSKLPSPCRSIGHVVLHNLVEVLLAALCN